MSHARPTPGVLGPQLEQGIDEGTRFKVGLGKPAVEDVEDAE